MGEKLTPDVIREFWFLPNARPAAEILQAAPAHIGYLLKRIKGYENGSTVVDAATKNIKEDNHTLRKRLASCANLLDTLVRELEAPYLRLRAVMPLLRRVSDAVRFDTGYDVYPIYYEIRKVLKGEPMTEPINARVEDGGEEDDTVFDGETAVHEP